MTVDEMLSRMSAHELAEWIAFDQVEPIGEARMDLRFAMLESLIANANRDPDRQPRPFNVTDFMVDFWKKVEPVDPEASWKHNKAVAALVTAALNPENP